MYYVCLTVECPTAFSEILMAELSEAGFDAFQETPSGFAAYVGESAFPHDAVEALQKRYGAQCVLSMHVSRIEDQNWNALWERHFDPVVVEGKCSIRAHFHPPRPDLPLDVVITPRMSFGTGHHETTYMMVKTLLGLPILGKRVMDVGCGTGILSIVASRLGARQVNAIDIDPWSLSNALDNLEVNRVSNVLIDKGPVREMTFPEPFDVVLANISRNTISDELPVYKANLLEEGLLVISGFLESDMAAMGSDAARHGFATAHKESRGKWGLLLLKNC